MSEYKAVEYGSYYCEVCQHRWIGVKGSHVCASKPDVIGQLGHLALAGEPQTPEQKEEAYLRWAREFKPEWLPAAMAEADAEQKEQSDACIKHYLDGLHAQLFDALTQTRNEQSKDIQAKRVIDILLAQRMGK